MDDEQNNRQPIRNQNNMQLDKKNNNKTMKITLIVIVAILVLIGVAVAAFFIGQQNKNQAVEQARQEAQQQAQQAHQGNNNDSQNNRPAHENPPAKQTTEMTCNADELSLALGEGSGAAGTVYYPITFTNTGDRTCTLYGYPGVSLVNDNGNRIGEPAEREEAEEATITLAPGQAAQSTVGVPNSDNFPAGECKDGATKLRVYPPNDTGYLSVASGEITTWCSGFNATPVISAP